MSSRTAFSKLASVKDMSRMLFVSVYDSYAEN